jgi:undecaprenyl phosphate-alpha-L-ara4N flippase subunit ArnE
VLLAVVLLTLGQVLQKLAVDRSPPAPSVWQLATGILRRPEMWAALVCLGGGMFAWLIVLGTLDVSKAFPFLSLGQILVLLIARLYFHEHLSLTRWIGALLIIAGVGLIAAT